MLDIQRLTQHEKKLKKLKKKFDKTEKILLLIIMANINNNTDFDPWADLSEDQLADFEEAMLLEQQEREMGECERLERLHEQEMMARSDFR